jgi:hypothetical protein
MTDEELIGKYAGGTEEQRYTTIYAQSENFVVFKVAGHKYWSSIMEPSKYTSVQYVLIHKGEHSLRGERREWEGKLTKARKQEIADALRRSELSGKVAR